MNDKRSHKNKRAAQAAEWFTKTMSGDLSPETGWQLRAWLAESPENRDASEFLGAIWDHSDVLADSPVAMKDLNEIQENKNRSNPKRLFHRLPNAIPVFRTFSIAAAVVLVFVSLWVFQARMPKQQTYATKTGELRTIPLSDGSTVHLDTETEITTRLSRDFRRIELIRGGALFSVFHDPNRPFIVDTETVSIRALGTEFKVRKLKRGKTTVAVTTGMVQVKRKQKGDAPDRKIVRAKSAAKMLPESETIPPMEARYAMLDMPPTPDAGILVNGQEMIIDAEKAEVVIKPVDVKKIHSWQNGQLYFNMAPLADVIEEINRYLDTKIIIADHRLREMQVSLNFNIKHRKYFLSTLKETLPITAGTDSSGHAVIMGAD